MKPLLTSLLIIALIGGYFYFKSDDSLFGADSGALSPGTMADDDTVGTVAWIDPTNAGASDNVYATIDGGINEETSHYLKATNFGFSIPAGATINGIVVEIERLHLIGGDWYTCDNEIKIVKSNGTIGTTNKSSGACWSQTESYVSFGGASDLWGETWLYSDINNSNFGVVLSTTGKQEVGYVDHIRITVYFSEAASVSQVQIRSGTIDINRGKICIGDAPCNITGGGYESP